MHKWVLKQGNWKIHLAGKTIVGREAFPEHRLLSRKHFELNARGARLWVTDLGSTNGTSVNGNLLTVDEAVELKSGDVIAILDDEFVAVLEGSGVPDRYPALVSALFGVLLLTALQLLDPSTAFGRAIGWVGIALLAGLALVSVIVVAPLWALLLMRQSWSRGKYVLYVLAVTSSAFLLSQVLIDYAGRAAGTARQIESAKIEYFCLRKSEPGRCAQEARLCPECLDAFDALKRTAVFEKLKAAGVRVARTRSPASVPPK